jgi:hypothetical protein
LQRDTDDTTEPDPGAESDHLPDPMLDQLRVAAAADADYRELGAAILSGFPTPRDKTTMSVRQYWSIRDGLSVDNGIASFGHRIIVPQSARREVLGKLHAAHQGIVRMKRRARQTVYWPEISNEITFGRELPAMSGAATPSPTGAPLARPPAHAGVRGRLHGPFPVRPASRFVIR